MQEHFFNLSFSIAHRVLEQATPVLSRSWIANVDLPSDTVGLTICHLRHQRPFANYYGLNYMLYELSTPFLNQHWFFDKLGKTGSRAQLINGVALLVSFAGARLVWGSYQSALLYYDFWQAWNYRMPAGSKCETLSISRVDVPIGCRILPTWLAVMYVGGTTVLSFLNFWWFKKMIAAVQKRFQPKEEGDKGNGEVKVES